MYGKAEFPALNNFTDHYIFYRFNILIQSYNLSSATFVPDHTGKLSDQRNIVHYNC